MIVEECFISRTQLFADQQSRNTSISATVKVIKFGSLVAPSPVRTLLPSAVRGMLYYPESPLFNVLQYPWFAEFIGLG